MRTINIPVRIHTKKISKTKTDSIFYAGKNIASVQSLGRRKNAEHSD